MDREGGREGAHMARWTLQRDSSRQTLNTKLTPLHFVWTRRRTCQKCIRSKPPWITAEQNGAGQLAD